MYPGYRFADTYSHQRNPMPPYMPSYYPNFEAPEMKMDPFRTPSAYEAWPHGGCHGCCNHSYMPGYTGFRPPYPPYTQPPPFHAYGGYPMYPETYPMHYMPPQPHYPRYEYEKPRDHHCCGCSNHQGNRKEDRPVKIEEQEPEAEKGKSDTTSLVPVEFHKDGYPYPVMWIPPGYMKNGENKKLPEPETKNSRRSEHKPDNAQGVFFPFDIKNLGGAVENGKDLKGTEEEKTVDKNQFPFPIFWMPYKPPEEEGKEKTEASTGSESAITLPSLQGSSVDGSSKPVESKMVKLKTIPVKQLEESKEKEMKASDNAVKSAKQSSEKKPSEHGTKRESSPPNTSKLPPVCLRVEPLKRRSRSVGSRSPSPPGDKEKPPRGSVRSSSSIMEKTRDVQKNEGDGLVEEKKSPGSIKQDNAATEEGNASPKEAERQVMSQEVSNTAKESCKEVKRKNLSEEEAALIIQAAFRGFGVRKWEPLKKLKQIASVKEQAIQVKNRIEGFELSGDVSIDNKQKLVIGETIMSLLLKLDTIQGLHPMVREIRKSVAKELVSLQEKLDSLAIEKPDAPIANPVVGLSADSKDGNPIPEEERDIEDDKSSFQADFVQGEELQSIPNVEEKKEDETPLSPLGHGEELQSFHAEDGEKGEVQQKGEMLNLPAGENVDYTTVSTPAVVNQELVIEETQRCQNTESCDCKDVLGEERLSPQGDEVVAAEDTSKPEDSVTAKENELFHLPSTEEHNAKVWDEASNTNEVTDVTQPQVPRTECCTELSPELELVENGTSANAPKSETSLEEDDGSRVGTPQLGESETESALGVPQTAVTLETTEAPTSEVPLEDNGIQENGIISLGDASQLEEPEDESFEDKEVVEEAAIELGIGAEDVQSAEEVPIQVSGEEKKEPLQEESKNSANDLQSAEDNAMKKTESDQKLLEENQRLKKMMEELIEAGKDQLSAITDLSGKVKYLERKLARKKKVKTRRTKSAKERIEDIGV